jgi:hypothetical protein
MEKAMTNPGDIVEGLSEEERLWIGILASDGRRYVGEPALQSLYGKRLTNSDSLDSEVSLTPLGRQVAERLKADE